MSIPKRMTVNCSKCGKPLSVTVFESVNSDYSDDIAMQIMSGELFDVECPHCKFVSHLEYDVLYHDLRHGAMIWVVHENNSDYEKKVAEVRSTLIFPYKTLRIVHDMNALREKVYCLESNHDDRIIELCKVFFTYNLLAQQPDFDFRNAFFVSAGGKNLIYFYDHENNNMCCELPDKAYDYLKEMYYDSHYAAEFDSNYAIVDYEWAEQILNPLLKGTGDASASNEDGEDNAEPANEESEDIEVHINPPQPIERKTCPECKATIPSDSAFCPKCGSALITHIQRDRIDDIIYDEMYGDYGAGTHIPQTQKEWEEVALEMGVSIETARKIRTMECEAVRRNKEEYLQNCQKWMSEAIALKKIYSQFSISTEIRNAKFKELIQHVDMKSAYELLHKDELFVRKSNAAESNSEHKANKQRKESAHKQEDEKNLLVEQRQEEIERQRIAEIQNERNLAILKRVAVQEAADKRKKIIKAIVIAIVVVLALILIINSARESAYNGQERNIAVGEMSDDFTNVYADVVSFKVEYTVTESKYKNDVQVGSSRTASVICKCTTVEGKEFWLRVPAWAYSGTIEYRGENPTSDYDDQYFSEPVRVRGYMTTFGSAVDNAPSYMEDTLILSCDGTLSSID